MNIKRTITCALAAIALCTAAPAQDADSLYAKDLLQPGTEAPDFTQQLYDKYGSNIRFVSVSFDDKREAWTSCIEQNNLRWLQVSELKKWKETNVSKLYNIKWIPAMYLIDRQGRIVLSTVMIEKLAAKLKELHEL